MGLESAGRPGSLGPLALPPRELQAGVPVQLQVVAVEEVRGEEAGGRGAERRQAEHRPARTTAPASPCCPGARRPSLGPPGWAQAQSAIPRCPWGMGGPGWRSCHIWLWRSSMRERGSGPSCPGQSAAAALCCSRKSSRAHQAGPASLTAAGRPEGACRAARAGRPGAQPQAAVGGGLLFPWLLEIR